MPVPLVEKVSLPGESYARLPVVVGKRSIDPDALYEGIRAALNASPPAGVSPAYMEGFWTRNGEKIRAMLRRTLEALAARVTGAAPPVAGPGQPVSKTVGLYLTRSGKEGARINLGPGGYSWSGEWGAGSGASREEYEKEFRGLLAGKHGYQTAIDFFARVEEQPVARPGVPFQAPGATSSSMADRERQLTTLPEFWKVNERTQANLDAMRLLPLPPSQLSDAQITTLTGYSGWGGLSIEKTLPELLRLDPTIPRPDPVGLIHEYYTPTRVCDSIAGLVRGILPTLPRAVPEEKVIALEPSCGIGRFFASFRGVDFDALQWMGVEMSPLSAAIVQRIYPKHHVTQSAFEEWIVSHETQVHGRVGLVVANPPYGVRGAYISTDTNRYYREDNSYLYFMRRCLDLLAKDGIGIFLVPAGWLTGRSAAKQKSRIQVLRRHHLAAAFRLPSQLPAGQGRKEALFPGAALVVDVLVFRARGGELPEVLPEDQFIVDARYFAQYPEHLLGEEEATRTEDLAVPGQASGDEDIQTATKQRYGYQVYGNFTGLPRFTERPLNSKVALLPLVAPSGRVRGSLARQIKEIEGLPVHLQNAVRMGLRIDRYLVALRKDPASVKGGWNELLRDLRVLESELGGPPDHNNALRDLAEKQGITGAQRLLSVYENGSLIPEIAEEPKVVLRYTGASDPISRADWRFRNFQDLTAVDVVEMEGLEANEATAESVMNRALHVQALLLNAGWFQCYERPLHQYPKLGKVGYYQLEPPWFYLTGQLWPKYDAAVKADHDEHQGSPNAQRQAREILKAIDFQPLTTFAYADVDVEKVTATGDKIHVIERQWVLSPRESWMPVDLLEGWIHERWRESVELERDGAILGLRGVDYEDMRGTIEGRKSIGASDQVIFFLGWANHDSDLFKPPKQEEQTPQGPIEENIDKARVRWAAEAIKSFSEYVLAHPEVQRELETTFNRHLRGYVQKAYSSEPFEIARWNPEGPTPYDYQWRTIRRCVENRRGLLALDVGLGKTYAAIAVSAIARQQGWGDPSAFLVPNSIVWKWFRDFQKCLPDYRVAVIGSERVVKNYRPWAVELISSWSEERNPGPNVAKLMAFLEGKGRVRLWEVKRDLGDQFRQTCNDLVWKFKIARFIYPGNQTAIGDQPIPTHLVAQPDSPEARAAKWTRYQAGGYDVALLTFSALGRTSVDIGMLRRYAESTQAIRREVTMQRKVAKRTKKPSERQIAVRNEGTAAWLAERLELQDGWVYDPGIDWHGMGVRTLFVDESQNFKNLFMPEPREGGLPDAMGSGESSKRAWQLDFRCASVREHSDGAGVFLLSATPAKNGPLEVYNFVHLMDPAAWERIGVNDPESFIDQFCHFSPRTVVLANRTLSVKLACTAFKQVDVLRGVIFRYGEFLTASDVGLKVPEARSNPQVVQLNDRQHEIIDDLCDEMDELREKMKNIRGQDESANGARDALAIKIQGLAMVADMVAIHPDLPGRSDDSRETIEAFDPHSPKIDAAVASVMGTRIEACDASCMGPSCFSCGHIIFVENVAVHYWLFKCLVEAGIDPDRIAILNAKTASDPETRQQMAMDFNGTGCPEDDDYEPPAYDIVIANSVAYEGVDLQRRTCKIMHLDLPWEPSTLIQRNGRGARQGNKFDVVEIQYFLAERSGDGRRLSKIENKRAWMISLFKGQDRTTANPMAGVDMTIEDLTLGYYRDPEKIAKIKADASRIEREILAAQAKASAERFTIEAMDAYQILRRSLANAEFIEPDTYAQSTMQYNREKADKKLEMLGQLEIGAWPWKDLVLRFRDLPGVYIPGGPVVTPGLWLRHDDDWHQVGRMTHNGNGFGYREYRTGQWRSFSNWMEKVRFQKMERADVSIGFPSNLEPEEPGKILSSTLGWLRYSFTHASDWTSMNLAISDEEWLKALWPSLLPQVWKTILNSSWGGGGQLAVFFPLELDGNLVLLGKDNQTRVPNDSTVLIPPTADGLRRAIELAKRLNVDPEVRKVNRKQVYPVSWSRFGSCTESWWNRRLPFGFFRRDEEEEKEEQAKSDQQVADEAFTKLFAG